MALPPLTTVTHPRIALMSKLLPSVLLAGFAALVGVGAAVGIGAFDVSASTPHWGVTTKFLQVVRDRSITARSADVAPPGNLEDRSQLVEGVVHFQAHCAVCHGAPGVEPSEIAHGMYPSPPDLGRAAMERSPAEIFWIVKNGIKMSGMPAWGGHGDERLWPVVALTSKLPTMTAAAYAELVAEANSMGNAHHSHAVEPSEPAPDTPRSPLDSHGHSHAH